jgi:hypothetical protein
MATKLLTFIFLPLFFYFILKKAEVAVDLEEVYVEADIEKVYSCFKNRFRNKKLWKKFDYDQTTISVEYKDNLSNSTHSAFTIVKQHYLPFLEFTKYKMSSNLNTVFENTKTEGGYIIKSFTESSDKLVNSMTMVSLLKSEGKKGTIIREINRIIVPWLFSSYTQKTCEEEHIQVIRMIQDALEKDPDVCS